MRSLSLITRACSGYSSLSFKRFFSNPGFLNIITIPVKNIGINTIPMNSHAF